MENASKALFMAAGVLIGIMILSIAVYVFSSFGGTSSQIQDNIRQNQVSKFNSQFTQYEGKDNVTIYDVISMANLATENNKYYGFTRRTSSAEMVESDNYIAVILEGQHIEFGEGNSSSDVSDYYNNMLSETVEAIQDESSSQLQRYTVQTQVSSITGRVWVVNCTES